MIRVSRRAVLASGVFAGSAAFAPGVAHVANAPTLVLFDSADLASLAFARTQTSSVLDVRREHAERWARLRAFEPGGAVLGLTSWTDWVIARGLLEEKGLRLRSERREGRLFRWEMA